MVRTFIDTGVLIAAACEEGEIGRRALEVLDDPNREFASSVFVRLEAIPMAVYFKNQEEAAFYAVFFDGIRYWAGSLDAIAEDAYQEACACGMGAMDALHVAAAVAAGCEEIVTTEKKEKPLHRTSRIKVVSLRPPADTA